MFTLNIRYRQDRWPYWVGHTSAEGRRKMWPCQLTAIHSVEASGVLISMPASTAVPELRGIWKIARVVQIDACDDSEHTSGIRCTGLDKSGRSLQEPEVLWRSQASESGLVILSLTNLLDTKDWFPLFSSCSRKVMAAELCNLPSSGHTICQPQSWEW